MNPSNDNDVDQYDDGDLLIGSAHGPDDDEAPLFVDDEDILFGRTMLDEEPLDLDVDNDY